MARFPPAVVQLAKRKAEELEENEGGAMARRLDDGRIESMLRKVARTRSEMPAEQREDDDAVLEQVVKRVRTEEGSGELRGELMEVFGR
jgi:hypothetical protein